MSTLAIKLPLICTVHCYQNSEMYTSEKYSSKKGLWNPEHNQHIQRPGPIYPAFCNEINGLQFQFLNKHDGVN